MYMKVKSLISIFLVGVVLVLAGCFKFEEPVLIENLSGDEIVFGADAQIEAQTKASSGTTETTSLTSFYVSAVTGSAGSESSAWTSTQFSQVAGSSPATYKGSKMWPASNPSYKFYVSNRPLTFAAAGTTVSATNTTDVVCAYLTNGTYKTKNTLTFEHIFARFGRVDVAAESGYTISNISIRITPKTGGTYNLRTGAGKTDGTGWSSVTTGSATVVANATGANANDIYLVPGTYEVKATWTATQSGTSITYTDKVVNVPAVGGKANNYTVTLGGEITFGVDLVEYCDYDYRDNLDYLTFFCDEAGTIGWKCDDASAAKTIQYSKDQGATWTNITSTTSGVTVSVSAGDIVWFKGSNSSYYNSDYNSYFTLSNKAHVYGNVNSLTGIYTWVDECCFCGLFNRCGSNLYTYDAKKIILPATTLAGSCYSGMFYGCTSLTTAPELPATTLASSCYNSMFEECTSLTTAPELPATTLAPWCYADMFNGCTSLKLAPELPATNLVSGCYSGMFSGCTSLKLAPELPATTLATSCYGSMFNSCTSLTTAPELPATTLESSCYYRMFRGCTSLKTAPELPATTLASNCYSYMFDGCSSLNYIKVHFLTEPNTSYTNYWLNNVASNGVFVKDRTVWDYEYSYYKVPVGWDVVEPSFYHGTFAGLKIAPVNLYYDGTFKFNPDCFDWNQDSYNSISGNVRGSYFFDFLSVGKYFDSRKNNFNDSSGDINNSGSKVAGFGNDSWRVPTSTEFSYIVGINDGEKRPGSYLRDFDIDGVRYAILQLTGVFHAGVSNPIGLLLFPDNVDIRFVRNLTYYNNSVKNVNITEAELQKFLEAGCVFLPASGYNSTVWYNGGANGYYWTATVSGSKSAWLKFGDNMLTTDTKAKSNRASVRLVSGTLETYD